MACLRASLASRTDLRSSASMRRGVIGAVGSGVLQSGQRSANPGLSGFNSNSSVQTLQILIGKGILAPSYDLVRFYGSFHRPCHPSTQVKGRLEWATRRQKAGPPASIGMTGC